MKDRSTTVQDTAEFEKYYSVPEEIEFDNDREVDEILTKDDIDDCNCSDRDCPCGGRKKF